MIIPLKRESWLLCDVGRAVYVFLKEENRKEIILLK